MFDIQDKISYTLEFKLKLKLKSESDVYRRRQILTSKVDPRAVF